MREVPFPKLEDITGGQDVHIIGQTVERTLYELKIPENPTRKQLGIMMAGLIRSLGIDFAFTDEERNSIHPAIRHWFKPVTVEIPNGQSQSQDEGQSQSEEEGAVA